ncbi:MAG: hypothetical protein M3081_02955 [Gemmatimonadota bacterium]|nr:hypothetical protein [Gemmatimonadota bacterium]
MSTKLGVLVIHGMGDPPADFAAAVTARLRRQLGQLAARVEVEPCFWSPILQLHQHEIWRRMQHGRSRMHLQRAREWIVSALGDPVGYLSGYFQDGQPVYAKIHECVRSSLAKLEARLPTGEVTPLAILAHSLGSVIISNYIWNEERDSGELVPIGPRTTTADLRRQHSGVGTTPFERMETLTTFVTYGSNIPLFLPPVKITECIKFPRDSLPVAYRAVARWVNMYDEYDVLGYPLGDLWDEGHGTQIDDVTMAAGPWPVSMTPLSHTHYHDTERFVEDVVAEVRRVLRVVK